VRFGEAVPLHEAVLRFLLLKDRIIDFAYDQALPTNALDLYTEEALERRICHFFDAAVYHLVCGYEEAMRGPTRMSS
jgi:hypothetical protein